VAALIVMNVNPYGRFEVDMTTRRAAAGFLVVAQSRGADGEQILQELDEELTCH
jgi:hypothetical protein